MSDYLKTLPNELLLAIFDRIPLANLLLLDRVCHRWGDLLPSAAERRHTLVLIVGGTRLDEEYFEVPFNDTFDLSLVDGTPFYDLSVVERAASLTLPFFMPKNVTFDEFLMDADDESEGFFDILYRLDGSSEVVFTENARFHRALLTGELVTYFTNLFPKVHTLIVVHTKCFEDELLSVIELVGSSSWSLGTLKLWLQFVGFEEEYQRHWQRDGLGHHPARTLMQSISQQTDLQRLTLEIVHDRADLPHMSYDFTFPAELYSFIGRLKVAQIHVGEYDADNVIMSTLHRFDHPGLSLISIGSCIPPPMDELLNPRFEFATKVQQLHWLLQFEAVDNLARFCGRFSSLTMLQISWYPNITFARLVSNLALLKQLTHLKLSFSFYSHPENVFTLMDRVEGDGAGEDGEVGRLSLPQLAILKLSFIGRSHHEFESLGPLVFPSIEVIMLYNYASPHVECATCRANTIGPYDHRVAKQCRRLLIRSMKNKFPAVRLYAMSSGFDRGYVDWSN